MCSFRCVLHSREFIAILYINDDHWSNEQRINRIFVIVALFSRLINEITTNAHAAPRYGTRDARIGRSRISIFGNRICTKNLSHTCHTENNKNSKHHREKVWAIYGSKTIKQNKGNRGSRESKNEPGKLVITEEDKLQAGEFSGSWGKLAKMDAWPMSGDAAGNKSVVVSRQHPDKLKVWNRSYYAPGENRPH